MVEFKLKVRSTKHRRMWKPRPDPHYTREFENPPVATVRPDYRPRFRPSRLMVTNPSRNRSFFDNASQTRGVFQSPAFSFIVYRNIFKTEFLEKGAIVIVLWLRTELIAFQMYSILSWCQHMHAISIGNHTVSSSIWNKCALCEVFKKLTKCKLISNWTRKTAWLLIKNNTNMEKFARK